MRDRAADGAMTVMLSGERATPTPPTQPLTALPLRRKIERRWVVLPVAAFLFVFAFALRQTSSSAGAELDVLYLMPIAMIALELGLLAGIIAAALGLSLLGAWLITTDAVFSTAALLSVPAAYGAVGAVAGRFSDRMRDANARQLLLLESGLALADLSLEGDLAAMLVEQVLRVVPSSGARAALRDGTGAQSGTPGDPRWQESFPIALHGADYGTVTMWRSRRLPGEDRATLAVLALQAAVAAENRQLLERQQDEMLARAELNAARVHLKERGGQLRDLITRQEAERGELSRELHDDAAQVLAAVLLQLKALERQLGGRGFGRNWRALRSDVDSTLKSLRSLAVNLRPPVLRLGLQAALEELLSNAHGYDEMTITLRHAVALDPQAETMVYRIAEEALEAVGPARRISIASSEEEVLVIEAVGPEREIDERRLSILKARIELAGGSLSTAPAGLRVVIPLTSGDAPEIAARTAE